MSVPLEVAVVGAGQIGTSFAMALTALAGRPAQTIGIWDLDPARRRAAIEVGGGGVELEGAEEALVANTVVLAIPVHEIVAWITTFGSQVMAGTLVLDTGSAKGVVAGAMRQHLAPGVHAIGGHPICGTEKSGPQAARSRLFAGASFALCEIRDDPHALRAASALVSSLGAIPVVVEPFEHDRILASTSHIVHLLAACLLEAVPDSAAERALWRQLVGPSFISTTRVMSGDQNMVAEFLGANADHVRHAVRSLQGRLGSWDELLDSSPGSSQAIRDRLRSCVAQRSALLDATR